MLRIRIRAENFNQQNTMNRIEISKRNGSTRTIWVPTEEQKSEARNLADIVTRLHTPLPCVHGFVPGRNCVTNAVTHVGDWRFTLSMDIADFFDYVLIDNLPEQIKAAALSSDIEFPNGRAVQGLPCSPALSNVAMHDADRRILDLRIRNRFGHNFVYTRYADDLTFSFNLGDVGRRLESEIPTILSEYGFSVNPSKTKWQAAASGMRRITGINVDSHGVHLPRSMKRRIRAATRQKEHRMSRKTAARFSGDPYAQAGQLRGLIEWSLLKTPKNTDTPTNIRTRQHSLPRPARRPIPPRPSIGLRAIIP